MRLIAFSLYGDDPRYAAGLLENCRRADLHYGGWQVRVYLDRRAGQWAGPLAAAGAVVVAMDSSESHRGMFWRLLAAGESGAEAILFRDADSRLGRREAAAVNAWLTSGEAACSIHDHFHHRRNPLMGGLWAVRGGMLPEIDSLVAEWLARHPVVSWGDDQRFLAERVYPLLARRGGVAHYAAGPVEFDLGDGCPLRPIPGLPRPGGEFCGQQYDADGSPVWPERHPSDGPWFPRAAVLCPGPSLGETWRPEMVDRYRWIVGVNRAVDVAACTHWAAKDARMIALADGGQATIVTTADQYRQMDAATRGRPLMDAGLICLDRSSGWHLYSATTAIAAAAQLGARAIDVYGADLAGTSDWDGYQDDQQRRDERRWTREREIVEATRGRLAACGVEVERRLPISHFPLPIDGANGEQGTKH